MKRLIVVLLLLEAPLASAEIKDLVFQNWKKCLEISNDTARLVVAPVVGGRVLHYSRDGGLNFLWEDPRSKGETLSKVRRWFPVGGYQCDIGPEIENPPQHLALWEGRYKAEPLGNLGVRLTSAEDEDVGIQIIKEVVLDPSGAGVRIVQTMKNVGTKETAFCLWDRTITISEYGFFPLNAKSRFPARWSQRQGDRRNYSYDGKSPVSPRVQIVGDLLVVIPGVKMEKVGADSMEGWVAGFREGWLYVKRYPIAANGDYADGGNTVELWVDSQKRMEIEPMSPKVKLAPGASYSLIEKWDLRKVEEKIAGAADVPKLLPTVKEMAPLPKE